MTTKEMIEFLQEIHTGNNPLNDEDVAMIAAIIKTLQDYDDLRLRLQDVKFPILGKIR